MTARPLQIAVDPTVAGVAGVRVGGDLTAESGLRLLRLLDDLLGRAARRGDVSLLRIDLGNVRTFEPAGVRLLRHARASAARAGVVLSVTGIGGYRPTLPQPVAALLDELATAEERSAERTGSAAVLAGDISREISRGITADITGDVAGGISAGDDVGRFAAAR
ncbi:Anti-anti-sigma regulatory factor (antagonist of anti-sigma factor) [Pseudonocardia thermophila]|jgi:Anti-anti-sigma regulatory factor (antagonist of anti-sigma factor)|uniref:Anti-anti-sigma regulatory factor (Antagonist of anti-sigma factor) n=1 Tax=Pseudonocardia thermophila TaxID=1848 RepID=A0A1M6V270_PSETH|nr:STAS domain-containing protein [Pseudonocardia thermophila]SHK75465.1 Anti-anti-sigma regulatory factor (antagonist of anti-sigma factor) [Pseudonocardia thermophila]